MRVRVDSADLTFGTFVAELDRPWLESPFLFQGVVIDDDSDLSQLDQVYCREAPKGAIVNLQAKVTREVA